MELSLLVFHTSSHIVLQTKLANWLPTTIAHFVSVVVCEWLGEKMLMCKESILEQARMYLTQKKRKHFSGSHGTTNFVWKTSQNFSIIIVALISVYMRIVKPCTDILFYYICESRSIESWGSHMTCVSHPLAQAAGKYRQQGRNYIVEDGDVIFFKFNAGAGLTAKKK